MPSRKSSRRCHASAAAPPCPSPRQIHRATLVNVNAIEGVTQSPYSHCGIVALRHRKWIVYEAYRGVEETSLREFVFRGGYSRSGVQSKILRSLDLVKA